MKTNILISVSYSQLLNYTGHRESVLFLLRNEVEFCSFLWKNQEGKACSYLTLSYCPYNKTQLLILVWKNLCKQPTVCLCGIM
jgi:hypothetical protein